MLTESCLDLCGPVLRPAQCGRPTYGDRAEPCGRGSPSRRLKVARLHRRLCASNQAIFSCLFDPTLYLGGQGSVPAPTWMIASNGGSSATLAKLVWMSWASI